MKRFASRKFIVAMVAQLAGLAMLIWPDHQAGIAAAADAVVAMAVVLLSALGYLTAEAAVDRARAAGGDASPKTRTPPS